MVSAEMIRSKGGCRVTSDVGVATAADVRGLDSEEATATGQDQSHDCGGTSQSSSRIWMKASPEGSRERLDAMFGESTEDMMWRVSVARTSQPREHIARLCRSG